MKDLVDKNRRTNSNALNYIIEECFREEKSRRLAKDILSGIPFDKVVCTTFFFTSLNSDINDYLDNYMSFQNFERQPPPPIIQATKSSQISFKSKKCYFHVLRCP